MHFHIDEYNGNLGNKASLYVTISLSLYKWYKYYSYCEWICVIYIREGSQSCIHVVYIVKLYVYRLFLATINACNTYCLLCESPILGGIVYMGRYASLHWECMDQNICVSILINLGLSKISWVVWISSVIRENTQQICQWLIFNGILHVHRGIWPIINPGT